MEEYPTTYGEFVSWFQDESSCFAYLLKLRWPNGVVCSRCGGDKFWAEKSGLFQCKVCEFKTSITANTIFQDRKKPLLK